MGRLGRNRLDPDALSVLLAGALMTLVFLSSRSGHDEQARRVDQETAARRHQEILRACLEAVIAAAVLELVPTRQVRRAVR